MASNLVASLLLVAMPFAPSSFLLLLVRHLLLVAMHLLLVASLLLVAMPFASSSDRSWISWGETVGIPLKWALSPRESVGPLRGTKQTGTATSHACRLDAIASRLEAIAASAIVELRRPAMPVGRGFAIAFSFGHLPTCRSQLAIILPSGRRLVP